MARFDASRLEALIKSDAALHEEIRKERAARDEFIRNARNEYESQSVVRLAALVRNAQQRLRGLRNAKKIPESSLIETDVTGFSSAQLRSILGSLQALFP